MADQPSPSLAHADLVLALLEHAGRALLVPSWPAPSPPESSPDVPTVEASVSDDGVCVVCRTATVVEDGIADAAFRPGFELRHRDVDGGDDDRAVEVGDDVGVEVPLATVAALATLLLTEQMAPAADGFVPLPEELWTSLRDSGRVDAVTAELRRMAWPGGIEPSTPTLQQLSAVCALAGDRVRGSVRVVSGEVPEFVALIVDNGRARVACVPAVGGRGSVLAITDAVTLAPPANDGALWHVLQRASLWNIDDAQRLAERETHPDGGCLELCAVVVDDVRAELQLTTRVDLVRGGDVVDAREVRCRLPVSPLALRTVVDADGLRRLQHSARRFLQRVERAAFTLGVGPDVLVDGSAWARVVVRAAAGRALEARGNAAFVVSDIDDDGQVLIDVEGDGGARWQLALSPADDAVLLRVGDTLATVYRGGSTIDGDDEGARAVCLTLAAALDGSGADADLMIIDRDGSERELTTSQWLRALAHLPHSGFLAPHREAAMAFADVIEALLVEG